MSELVDRQSASSTDSSGEKIEHDNARFDHWQEEQAWEQEAQRRKIKIISSVVAAGALVFAWMSLR